MSSNRILRKIFVNKRIEITGFGENLTVWNFIV
jgi:hypothetical protein